MRSLTAPGRDVSLKDVSLWIMGVACFVVGGSVVWNHIQSKASTSAVLSADTSIDVQLLERAAQSEAERIKMAAPSDAECGVTPDPSTCFINRLTAENNERIAEAILRQRALEIAGGK